MDKRTFKKWLAGAPRVTYLAATIRSALRALPMSYYQGPYSGDAEEILLLLACRSILSSYSACTHLQDKSSIDAAARAVESALEISNILHQETYDYAKYLNCRDISHTIKRIILENTDKSEYLVASAVAPAKSSRIFPKNTKKILKDDLYEDIKYHHDHILSKPLWHSPGKNGLDIQKEDFFLTADWSFWREWYQGFLNGEPLDSELQRRIALISDVDWEKGPEHIAKIIEDIRKDFDKPKLDAEQLTEQAKRLAANPKSTKIVANATADTIEHCVREFMLEEDLNQLPDTLESLHRLPALLRAMGDSAQDEGRLAELEEQIAQLVGEVARLTTELEAAKRVNLQKLAKDTAVKTTVQIATAGFWGLVAAGFGHLAGVVDVGTLLERLGEIGSAPPVPEQLAPRNGPFTTET